jgi:hypothetical protein
MNYFPSALLATALSLSTPAFAAESTQGPGPLQVYDSQGTFVGVLLNDTNIAREYKTTWYEIGITADDLNPNASFYFTTTNCTGQRYLLSQANYLPVLTRAFYQEAEIFPSDPYSRTLWVPDPNVIPTSITAKSVWYQYLVGTTNLANGACYATNQNVGVQTPVPLDTVSQGFSPPFCVATHQCAGRVQVSSDR